MSHAKPKNEQELNDVTRRLGKMVQGSLPDRTHMVLFLMNTDKPGWISYVSTARRGDVVDALEEMLPRMKRGAKGPAAQAVLFEVVRRLRQVRPGTEKQAVLDVADLVEFYVRENGWEISSVPDLVRSFDGSIATLRAIRHIVDAPGPLTPTLQAIEWDRVRDMVKKYFEKFMSSIDFEEPGNPIGDESSVQDEKASCGCVINPNRCRECGKDQEDEIHKEWTTKIFEHHKFVPMECECQKGGE